LAQINRDTNQNALAEGIDEASHNQCKKRGKNIHIKNQDRAHNKNHREITNSKCNGLIIPNDGIRPAYFSDQQRLKRNTLYQPLDVQEILLSNKIKADRIE
jgi:hypothetical protein